MQIKQLTVRIEYRIDAGSGLPRWKALRARVLMTDASGYTTYGSDLFPANITSIDMAIAKSLKCLRHVETVLFVFDEKLGLVNRAYREGRLLSYKMVG